MRVVIGRIGRAHGIKGDVAVDVRTDEPHRRFAVGATVLCAGRPRTIAAARQHAGRLLVRLEGVADRTAAEGLNGTLLEVDVDPDEVPEDPDDYYDHQLVGLRVADHTGHDVGTVREVLHLPHQDLLAVVLETGREALVPFVHALVPDVDLAVGRVVLADVPGLLDPDAAEVVPTEPDRPSDQA